MSDAPVDDAPAPRRSDFGRSVGLGLAAAGLAAVAAHRQWVTTDTGDDRAGALASAVLADGSDVGSSPAAGAVALVLLAAWGALLVTRGRVRRVVAVLALLAAVGLTATVVSGRSGVPDTVRTALGPGSGVEVGLGLWFWVTAVAAVVSIAATAHAVRRVPAWPEMGSRYDAPTAPGATPPAATGSAGSAGTAGSAGAGGSAGPAGTGEAGAGAEPTEDRSNLDLWRSIDDGRDPTA